MDEVGVRALKQNASEVLAQVERGESMTVTSRGRTVAVLSPFQGSALDRLVARGARMPRRSIKEFVELPLAGGLAETTETLSETLQQMRREERY